MMSIAHFLVGIPGSGKSTLARCLAHVTQGQIISSDRIREDLYGDAQIQGDWTEIESEILQQMQGAIAAHQTIIYDATNVKGIWRREFLQKTPSQLHWIAWVLNVPLDICTMRNQRRSRQVLEAIIEAMYTDLQTDPPTIEDGFLRIINIYPNFK